MTDVRVLYLAETVTTDGNGETIEGDNGLMVDGEFKSMAGVSGIHAVTFLALCAEYMDAREAADVLDAHGPYDHVDERDGELIAYVADVPNVGDDVPYIRAVAVKGQPRIVRVLATRLP